MNYPAAELRGILCHPEPRLNRGRGIFQLGKIPPLSRRNVGVGRNDYMVSPEAELRRIIRLNIKNKKYHKILFADRFTSRVLIFFCGFVMITGLIMLKIKPVEAQSLSLTISPPLVEIMIKPGKTVTQAYKIRNDGEPAIVKISLVEYKAGDLQASPDYIPENWIQIINNDLSFNTPFLLNSNQEKQVILKINPPVNTPEEEYYRILMFSTSPNPASQFSQSSISQNLGSVILVSVTRTGEKLKAAQLTKFAIPALMDSFDPLIVDFDLQNTGKIYIRPIGEIKLDGQASFKILPKIVLPNQIKRLVTDNSKTDGQELHSLYLPGFYLGKHQVNIAFTLDEGKIKIEQSKTFYALPWKIFVVLIILLFAAYQYWKIKKREHA